MAPRLVLIRHAQALHNVADLGVEQCDVLKKSLIDRFGSQELDATNTAIIASPMRRTLQTAQLATGWLVDKGIKIVANADWQELSAKPCDTGSAISDVQPDFPAVDFSSVDPVWPDKTSPEGKRYAYTREAILARGRHALEDLRARPEKLIFVISHSGFLRSGIAGYWWMNADYRIFDMQSGDSVELTQDETTLSGGLGVSWTEPVELGSGIPEE